MDDGGYRTTECTTASVTRAPTHSVTLTDHLVLLLHNDQNIDLALNTLGRLRPIFLKQEKFLPIQNRIALCKSVSNRAFPWPG